MAPHREFLVTCSTFTPIISELALLVIGHMTKIDVVPEYNMMKALWAWVLAWPKMKLRPGA
jgi:hypothetical protein